MSFNIHAHIKTERIKPVLRTVEADATSTEYKVLKISDELTIFATDVQLEQIFDALDKGLHEETYLQLQDRAFGLEVDLDTANDLIERLEAELQDVM